jgi:hypothetical protein
MGLLHMLNVYVVNVKKRMGRGAAVVKCATVCTCVPWLNVYVHFRIV